MDASCSFSKSSLTQPSHHPAIVHPNLNHTSSDLPATISIIQNLTILAESTLKSISEFLTITPLSSAAGLLGRCPFDCHHLMPPESLFRHFLTCSSAPGSPLLDLAFLDRLRYLKSLKSEDQLLKENLFVRPLPDTETDLCFSLEGELADIDSSFFYKDCPGVVTFPELDATSRTFALPGILSTECANFINDHSEGYIALEQKLGILPSDFWALKSEVESWSSFPATYSFATLLVAAGLHEANELSLKRWAILNSPKFGIVIDAAMRDHIFLLLKLCLKAARREAVCSLKIILVKEGFLDPRVVRCDCLRLVSSLTWLTSQVSILYGEENGKSFVMGMLKESFLLAGRCLMMFNGEEKNVTRNAEAVASGSECSGKEFEISKPEDNLKVRVQKPSENTICDKVFVSQVASAIAALHERSSLEQRIKALRFTPPPSRFQLINEYMSTTSKAAQQRAKRPNYRPLLEHDGLLWQRATKQEFEKSKTREELLAEERDYKRRRMSYRGKKLKRNPMQVLHDIIEEHMEEIRMAGGIGCKVKLSSETAQASKSERDTNQHLELQCNANDAYAARSKKSQHNTGSSTAKSHEYDSFNDASYTSFLKKTHHETRYDHLEDRHRWEKSKEMPHYRSRSPSYYSNYSYSGERDSQQMDRINGRPCGWNSNHSSSYKEYDSRSNSTSNSREDTRYKHSSAPKSKRRYTSGAFEKQWKDSNRPDMFDDRYQPSRSYGDSDALYEGSYEGSHDLR